MENESWSARSRLACVFRNRRPSIHCGCCGQFAFCISVASTAGRDNIEPNGKLTRLATPGAPISPAGRADNHGQARHRISKLSANTPRKPVDNHSSEKKLSIGMRSLLISGSYFPPQVGGISTMMAEICKELGERRVAVLTGVKERAEEPALGRVRIPRMDAELPSRSSIGNFRLITSLGLALVRERPSVLQYATLEDAYLAYWTHKALRIPHLSLIHI